ncbi:MAG: T9SS type A sorting domain-containing protein [Bacteroidaceae bacterium]|nr:T9SS type A sorting domain-containing protein [Bacteroidaceae bacterium]
MRKLLLGLAILSFATAVSADGGSSMELVNCDAMVIIPKDLMADQENCFAVSDSNTIRVFTDEMVLAKTLQYPMYETVAINEYYSLEDGSLIHRFVKSSKSHLEIHYYDDTDRFGNEMHDPAYLTSQTLFNTDSKYEIIRPIYTVVKQWEDESTFYDNTIGMYVPAKEVYYTSMMTGIEIVSEDGNVLNTLHFEGKLNTRDIDIMNLNGKIYLIHIQESFDYTTEKYIRKTVIYRVDNKSTSIEKVMQLEGVNVFPTLARRDDVITVSIEGDENAEVAVSVIGANGQVLNSGRLGAGERQMTLPANKMNSGLNIIKVQKGGQTSNTKVLVE